MVPAPRSSICRERCVYSVSSQAPDAGRSACSRRVAATGRTLSLEMGEPSPTCGDRGQLLVDGWRTTHGRTAHVTLPRASAHTLQSITSTSLRSTSIGIIMECSSFTSSGKQVGAWPREAQGGFRDQGKFGGMHIRVP